MFYAGETDVGPHAMTLVGYNDNIWIDVNGSGEEESGERGAFKIVNTWGESYANDGFCWVAYDALNTVSSVPSPTGVTPSPTPVGERQRIFDSPDNVNRAYWITAKDSYTPKLIGQFKVNHAKRIQLSIKIGYSPINQINPVKYLDDYPFVINYHNNPSYGNVAFDGTNTACDGEFALDFTDLIDKENLGTSIIIGGT
jgi:hypothetical protein